MFSVLLKSWARGASISEFGQVLRKLLLYFPELLNYLDPKIDPCEDFYKYACGGWIKRNPLPTKKTVWNQFTKLEEETSKFINNILQNKEIQAEYSKV